MLVHLDAGSRLEGDSVLGDDGGGDLPQVVEEEARGAELAPPVLRPVAGRLPPAQASKAFEEAERIGREAAVRLDEEERNLETLVDGVCV